MGLGAIFVSVLLVFHQQPAVAGGVGCGSGIYPPPISLPYCKGYFTTATATDYKSTRFVLPSGLFDSNAASLESDIWLYLAGLDPANNGECGTPKGPFRPTQCMAGAAFIIEAMLGHGAFNSSVAAGVAQVKAKGYAEYNNWVYLVNSYATSTVPGYYVTWGSAPVCIINGLNSGFSDIWPGIDPPVGINYDIFHYSDCPLDTTSEIQFHWPASSSGPAGSFDIGENCGNIENSIGKIPPVLPTDRPPTGTITIKCVGESQIANVSFNDPDGPTNAYITQSSSGGPPTKFVFNGNNDITTFVSPLNSLQIMYLYVQDILPGGSTGSYVNVAHALTQPCPTFSCGSWSVVSATGAPSIDSSMKFNVTVSVNIDSGTPPPSANMYLYISGPSPGTTKIYNKSPLLASGNPLTVSVNGLGPTNNPGIYTLTWNLNSPYSVTKPPCIQQFPVTNLPYLQVYGGDVMIGASPSYDSGTSTSSCVANNNAGIYGWNNGNPSFSGAGTQYAVQALAQIDGFASAQYSTSSPPTSPTGLSFANNSTDLTKNIFGGSFIGTTGDCYFTSNINANLKNGPKTIADSAKLIIGNGLQVTDYIKGNVYIANNIVYDQSGWTISPTINIPYYRLVVIGGNIYIDQSVTELDGLYVAEPENSGSGTIGGKIYTCATGGISAPLFSPLTIKNYYTTCGNQLKIYGSFVAGQVQFLRTFGTLGSSTGDNLNSNKAGEVFDYTPEMWLPRNNGITDNGYTAITSLPPVL